ncbi:shikimate kinase [Streptomyces niveus]|uniref:Shikimate kinase n=1 Tax=Streptomyces niveus TaxID=193462 RepID=A0A1U9R0Q3_STRNV|nr:shikimate kinase [Streptomyces niveus]AQU69671.1 shikimate kinase [Streptomyces niveus]
MSGPLIVLVGPMGVGKTTVGALLAERLDAGYRDTDADIVAAEGREISDIFFEDGEEHFRELERAAVRSALAEHPGVVALGGGAILDKDTRELLAGLPVVYLSMEANEAVRRTGLGLARPLLAINPRQQWKQLMEERRALYTEVARAVVPTDERAPEVVAEAVIEALGLGPAAVPGADPSATPGKENQA